MILYTKQKKHLVSFRKFTTIILWADIFWLVRIFLWHIPFCKLPISGSVITFSLTLILVFVFTIICCCKKKNCSCMGCREEQEKQEEDQNSQSSDESQKFIRKKNNLENLINQMYWVVLLTKRPLYHYAELYIFDSPYGGRFWPWLAIMVWYGFGNTEK